MPARYADSHREAYAAGDRALAGRIPQGAIIVFSQPGCPHCQGALNANGNITQTANGTPVIWVDATSLTAAERSALGFGAQGYNYANGTVTGTPSVAVMGANGQLGPIIARGNQVVQPNAMEMIASGQTLPQVSAAQARPYIDAGRVEYAREQAAATVTPPNCDLQPREQPQCPVSPGAAPTAAEMRAAFGRNN